MDQNYVNDQLALLRADAENRGNYRANKVKARLLAVDKAVLDYILDDLTYKSLEELDRIVGHPIQVFKVLIELKKKRDGIL